MQVKKKLEYCENKQESESRIACERAQELGPFWPENHQNNPVLPIFHTWFLTFLCNLFFFFFFDYFFGQILDKNEDLIKEDKNKLWIKFKKWIWRVKSLGRKEEKRKRFERGVSRENQGRETRVLADWAPSFVNECI